MAEKQRKIYYLLFNVSED